MKRNKLLLLALSFAAAACTPIAPPSGRIPVSAHSTEAAANPFAPPPGTPDGAFSTRSGNGRTLKGTVRNGMFVGTVEVYHPNGRLHSRTPVQNGRPEGLSQGYGEDGRLRTEIFYRNGRAVRFKRFNAAGKVEAEGNL